jgi:hypothetical protein
MLLGVVRAAHVAGPVLDLHPFVDNQCCTAISHLQQEAKIPNSGVADVVDFPNSEISEIGISLIFRDFRVWHGSCSVKGKTICQVE